MSSQTVHEIELELIRQGSPHNQLLSPLTPYLALSGRHEACTLHLPFEHARFLDRLEALRYDPARSGSRVTSLDELAEAMGELLGAVPGLLADLCTDGGQRVTHLRLVFSAQELSLLPFELARSPRGFPGEGRPLFLQSDGPISISRQTRCTSDAVDWTVRPRILFAWAGPAGGIEPELVMAHLQALRRAISPQLRDEARDLPERITVIERATCHDLEAACRNDHYTHVHLVAHGTVVKDGGEERFGLAMHAEPGSPTHVDAVSGERLVRALRTPRGDGFSRPVVVSIAACDSAQQRAVTTPGGSLAHTLHEEGVPIVVASQFPLTKAGSVRMTELLYRGLLGGEDPRVVLHAVRCALAGTTHRDHDWASLIAYLAVPADVDAQLLRMRYEAARDETTAAMERARLAVEDADADEDRFDKGLRLLEGAIDRLRALANSPARTDTERLDVVRSLNLIGAAEKRKAEFLWERGRSADPGVRAARDELEKQSLLASRDAYRSVLKHQPIGSESTRAGLNTLALTRLLDGELEQDLWCAVHYWLTLESERSTPGSEGWAWMQSTRLFLDVLALEESDLTAFVAASEGGYSPERSAMKAARELANRLVPGHKVHRSTRRELRRYTSWWAAGGTNAVARVLSVAQAALARQLLVALGETERP